MLLRATGWGAVLIIGLCCTQADAQAVIRDTQPRGLMPGQSNRLVVVGEQLDQRPRFVSDLSGIEQLDVVEVAADRLVVDIRLTNDIPPGPLGLWLATDAGPADPIMLLVDELPSLAMAGDHHSPPAAQLVPNRVAIDGTAQPGLSHYYRFEVAAGERLAFEILTQPFASSMDPMLRLLDADGRMLAQADDDHTGPDCRFAYRFSDAGQYTLEVRDSRYQGGGHYRLRIGDFPIIDHPQPLLVAADAAGPIRFTGPDAAAVQSVTLSAAATGPSLMRQLPARFIGGSVASWSQSMTFPHGPVHSLAGDRQELGSGEEPLAWPLGLAGQLSQPGERHRVWLRGEADQTVSIIPHTRSLGSAALPRLRLLRSDGGQVAINAVSDADQWPLTYRFTDSAAYQLEISDLLDRGGSPFGYALEIVPETRFALQLKVDPLPPTRIPLEPTNGAQAIQLDIARLGYTGPIELELTGQADGLRLLNPSIGAGAQQHRLLVVATPDWDPEQLRLVGLRGRAVDDPARQATLSSQAWLKKVQPHVLSGAAWRDGRLAFGGVAAGEPWFQMKAPESIDVVTSADQHQIAVSVERLLPEFKAAVSLLPDPPPAGWSWGDFTAEGDTHRVVIKRVADQVASQPERLGMWVYAEHAGRGRISRLELPLRWVEPVEVQLELAGRLRAGGPAELVAHVAAQVPMTEPMTLTLVDLPAGFQAGEAVTLAPGQSQARLPIRLGWQWNEQPIEAPLAVSLSLQVEGTAGGAPFTRRFSTPPQSIQPLPQRIEVFPAAVTLSGPAAHQQLLVTGFDGDGTTRDWTEHAHFEIESSECVRITPRGELIGVADGQTQVRVRVGPWEETVTVAVSGSSVPRHPQFESEVLVALSKQGCNSGACHGSPSGKGMFRLSLRAFDPPLDELTLIREDYGRRVNLIEPEQSLLLLKPLMQVAHGGGQQLRSDDPAYGIILDWIAAGAPSDPPGTPRVTRLEVYPNQKRVLPLADGEQQLAATAHFADGSHRDVTPLVAYESSNTEVATVDAAGRVTPHRRGEAVILVRFLEHIEPVPLMFVEQLEGFVWQAPATHNYIDELVDIKLQQLQYLPSPVCEDHEFVRRVYLDVIGILPTIDETLAFLDDETPDKRARLIDRLLEREEYARFWALKWGDFLRMTNKTLGTDGLHKYHRWIEQAFHDNLPYDQFAHQLLTASGSTLSNPPANFYRSTVDMSDAVESISQVFLGARLQCAKCHNHPFERWTQDNYYGLGAMFAGVQRRATQRPGEMFIWTRWDEAVIQPRTGQRADPWLFESGHVEPPEGVDRRELFADWLTGPSNPYFAKMEVNRMWAQLFSRGIVDPIDDLRDSNPPSHEAVLEALADDFVASGFDRRHILRTILNSRTYQASFRPQPGSEGDDQYFSHQQPRLLSAEQLLDAINHATGVEQKFGILPEGTRATHLPAPDLVSVDFLKVFGQPERSTVCACERADDSNLGMAIELFNGTTVHQRLQDPNNRFRRAVAAEQPLEEIIEQMYLATLARRPTDQELQTAVAHCRGREEVVAGLEDIGWALLNTDEFLFQH
jgi:hypothetical protein